MSRNQESVNDHSMPTTPLYFIDMNKKEMISTTGLKRKELEKLVNVPQCQRPDLSRGGLQDFEDDMRLGSTLTKHMRNAKLAHYETCLNAQQQDQLHYCSLLAKDFMRYAWGDNSAIPMSRSFNSATKQANQAVYLQNNTTLTPQNEIESQMQSKDLIKNMIKNRKNLEVNTEKFSKVSFDYIQE